MRIRLTFSKKEIIRFTSHLDLHHTLERTFRRARLPVAYSKGFNPRPRLNLAAALPLGITSDAEIAEIWLYEKCSLAEIQTKLRENTPPGLEILNVEEVKEGTPKLPNLVQSAEYAVTLSTAPSDLDKRVENLLVAETIQRHRRDKVYDLRPLIEELEITLQAETETILLMRLRNRPNATGRPDEVLSALEIPIEETQIHRTRLILN